MFALVLKAAGFPYANESVKSGEYGSILHETMYTHNHGVSARVRVNTARTHIHTLQSHPPASAGYYLDLPPYGMPAPQSADVTAEGYQLAKCGRLEPCGRLVKVVMPLRVALTFHASFTRPMASRVECTYCSLSCFECEPCWASSWLRMETCVALPRGYMPERLFDRETKSGQPRDTQTRQRRNGVLRDRKARRYRQVRRWVELLCGATIAIASSRSAASQSAPHQDPHDARDAVVILESLFLS
jgi:hypothetical protein